MSIVETKRIRRASRRFIPEGITVGQLHSLESRNLTAPTFLRTALPLVPYVVGSTSWANPGVFTNPSDAWMNVANWSYTGSLTAATTASGSVPGASHTESGFVVLDAITPSLNNSDRTIGFVVDHNHVEAQSGGAGDITQFFQATGVQGSDQWTMVDSNGGALQGTVQVAFTISVTANQMHSMRNFEVDLTSSFINVVARDGSITISANGTNAVLASSSNWAQNGVASNFTFEGYFPVVANPFVQFNSVLTTSVGMIELEETSQEVSLGWTFFIEANA